MSADGQIIMVSDEIPLWQFGGFNLGKFERYPAPCKPWLYSWVMNNYWFTNFRAFQEGGFHWTYQITTTKDTTNAAAAQFARELDGKPGAITISSAIEGRPIRRMVEVNVIGEELGQPLESVKLNPFEVKFIQIEY